MKSDRSQQAPANRRGSPDVVEKRRAARAFNEAMRGEGSAPRDGRTERRRQRLLKELAAGVVGRARRALTPVDVLSRVRELLELGEPLAAIKKACPARRPIEPTPAIAESIRRLHRAYAFPLEAYRFIGVGEDLLRAAGVLPGSARAAPAVRRAKAPAGPGLSAGKPSRAPGVSAGETAPSPKPRAPRRGVA